MRAYSRWVWLIVTLLLLVGVTAARAGEKSDADLFVGRWDHCGKKTTSYLRFYPLKDGEGRLKAVDGIDGLDGKWRLLDDGIIELFLPYAPLGRRVIEVKYLLYGDTLELKMLKRWEKYERAR